MDTASTRACGYTGIDPSRCDATLPDAPDCAINYHFGMLLGVEDFRAEQGFHVGQHRRHQRALHGWGVVFGYAVGYAADRQEIRVEPGHAVDHKGRDLVLDAPQCLGLPAWWEQQRDTEAFADIVNKDDATFDADVLLCYRACLARAVPAIADPCAQQTADIAYSRMCEQVKLTLVRRPAGADPAPPAPSYRLLRRVAGLLPPLAGDEETWLAAQLAALAGLSGAARDAAGAALWRQIAARAAAATLNPLEPVVWRPPPDIEGLENRDDCLVIARLSGVHLVRDGDGWKSSVATLAIDGRATLLPTQVLQALAPPPPAPAAGPMIVLDSGSIVAQSVLLRFDRPLAPAAVKPAAFTVTEFDRNAGWSGFTVTKVTLDDGDQKVTLALDRAPAAKLLRVTANGQGPTPLLGVDLIPIGAPANGANGANLSLTLSRS